MFTQIRKSTENYLYNKREQRKGVKKKSENSHQPRYNRIASVFSLEVIKSKSQRSGNTRAGSTILSCQQFRGS